MKETKIEIPAGCEVEKIETQDGHVLVTFKEKERKLPKTWEEFCEMYPNCEKEFYINDSSVIKEILLHKHVRFSVDDQNVLPDRATAEAVLSLCQLIQLRNAYNGDWVPDWEDNTMKYAIELHGGEINRAVCYANFHFLCFKTAELRNEFLRNFRDLIEKLKPLYGIKEGGER